MLNIKKAIKTLLDNNITFLSMVLFTKFKMLVVLNLFLRDCKCRLQSDRDKTPPTSSRVHRTNPMHQPNAPTQCTNPMHQPNAPTQRIRKQT